MTTLIAVFASSPFSSALGSDCSPVKIDAPDTSIQIDPVARQRQSDALRGMSLETIEYSPRGPIEQIVGDTKIVLPPDVPFRLVGGPASDLLSLFKELLLASGTETLTIKENSVWYGDERTLELAQSIRGMAALHSGVSLSYNARTRRVSSLTAHFIPDRDLPRKPRLSAREAKHALRRALALAEKLDPTRVVIDAGAHLGYFASFDSDDPAQLVWAFTAHVRGEREEFLVNSLTGIVAYRWPLSFSIVGRREPPREITGTRCQCAGKKSFIPVKPFRSLPNCGRLVGMNWSPMPDADRYVAQMALPELGWVFSDLVIDNASTQCTCEVPRTAHIRMMACNSCGCGPWSKAKVIEVELACPVLDDMPTI